MRNLHDSSLTRVQPFFTPLISVDPSGRSWLPGLLAATPKGDERLGDLIESPGSLSIPLSVPGIDGRLGCFGYPVGPPRDLLGWYIDHPDHLTRQADAELPETTRRLRRALIDDDPPGARAKAQDRAHDLLAASTGFTPAWWRFEGMTKLDCLLMTDRLVITVEGNRSEPLKPATDWYSPRTQLVRNLEAARQIADGRQWASLIISERPLVEASDEFLERTVANAAPHLDRAGQAELHDAYLGNLTWEQACDAVGLSFADLPDHAEAPD